MSDRFNEGLEQGMQLGTLKERKRILELLDDKIATIFREGDWSRATLLQELRAVIKGEQK